VYLGYVYISRYFGADGFTYGSSLRNWVKLQQLASQTNTVFIPSVGPGYIDVSVRPWNAATTRDRKNGDYYMKSWQAALRAKPEDRGRPHVVSVTSFNEWHEGSCACIMNRESIYSNTFTFFFFLTFFHFVNL
jgi:glycoprotein endo-alpha-1,2-mannosidase